MNRTNFRIHPVLTAFALVPLVAANVAFAAQDKTTSATSAAPAAQSTTAKQTPTQAAGIRQLLASRLIGMSVRGSKGENIGQVDDLAIDMKSGQVRYAVLEFDPGFFSAERMLPVPVKELRLSKSGNDLVYGKADKAKIEKMAMKKGDWNDDFLRDKDRVAKLENGWGMPQQGGLSLVRANHLMDKEVQNRAGDNIGEIEDLVINMDRQNVHYAMLEFERSWLKPEKTVAVPLSAFTNPAGSGDQLVLDVTPDKVKDLQTITREQRRHPNDPQVIAVVERHIVFLEPKGTASANAKSDSASDTRASGAQGAANPSTGSGSSDKMKK